MSAPSDQLLAQRASGGDVLAFEVLVRRYQLRVLRLCVGMLGDQHAAEVAAQDVFFSAWRSVGRFRGDAPGGHGAALRLVGRGRCLLRPLAVVVSGAPGSGKTTQARQLSEAMGLPHLNKDLVCSSLHRADLESPVANKRTFEITYGTARTGWRRA